MAAPLLALEGVGKTFDNGIAALKDVRLVVGRGEFVSVLGPSGCGKSTLLRIVAGLAEPSEGRVRGAESDWPARRARGRVGFVFQEPALLPWATVADNVMLPLRLTSVERGEASARVRDALELVDLAEFALAYPRQLSGGMKMRVSLARALVTRPDLMLLDEPFGALDELTRFKLNDDLLRLWRGQGWTVLFVTHSVFESVFLSERIVVMTARPGRIASEVAIDLPYPREPALRTSAEFAHRCRAVSMRLAEATV